jgi:hypothetical protein
MAVNVGLAVFGGLLGSAPWWGYALRFGPQALVAELGGAAISGVEGLPFLEQAARHGFNLFVLGLPVIFGLRPPWEVRWLALPLLPFGLAFWLGVVGYIGWRLREKESAEALTTNFKGRAGLLAGVMITLAAGFVLTPFGVDPSGRYFLPLAVPLALFGADLALHLRRAWGKWAWGVVILVLAFNLWGTVESAGRFPPGLTTQFDAGTRVDHHFDGELIAFLQAHGETRGYTNYWTAYPLAFLSQEALIFVPQLPYHLDFRHTARDDRYPPYGRLVAEAGRVAYITANHPPLDERLRAGFLARGAAWQEAEIGDYRVFYGLSRAIRPEEIGLGAEQ